MFLPHQRRWPSRIFLTVLFALVGALGAGCRRSASPVDTLPNLDAINDKMRACLPARRYRANDGNVRIAIAGLTRLETETKVRIVAYAGKDAGAFDLPVYYMSRGRWMINETGRAFLIDQDCRQYRLKGRSSTSGLKIPLNGRIELQAGQSFESDLSFPRLVESPHILIMVYGDLIMLLPPLNSSAQTINPHEKSAS